jgi:hypothetical protein
VFPYLWKDHAIIRLIFIYVLKKPSCLLNVFSLTKLLPLERFFYLREEFKVMGSCPGKVGIQEFPAATVPKVH